MKTKIYLLITLLLATLMMSAVFFTACDSAEKNDSKETTEAASETTEAKTQVTTQETTAQTTAQTTVNTTESSVDETVSEQIDGYKVTVVDEDGNPLEGIYVQFCRGDLCMAPYSTDENGVIIYNYADDDYSVKAIDYNFVYESEEPEYTLKKGEKELTIVMKKIEG